MDSVSFDGYSYHTQKVEVPGGNVMTYSIGTGREVLLVLHGGPGMSCDYVRDSHARLAGDRYRIVSYDQLGSGASDRPTDPTLWRLGRFVEEVEAVRTALGLGKVHLFGQSWGAFLAVEYALTHNDALRTLILEGGAADMPHLASEMLRLKMALGSETVAMMARHEAEGTNDHPEYQGAQTVLSWRHICRLATWPESLKRSIGPENMNGAIFNAIQGRSEFTITGNIKDWNRVADLHRIGQPALVLCGQYEIVTPECAARMHRALPNSSIAVFPNSSHTPFLEEPEAYFAVFKSFLDENTAVRL